MAFNSLPPAFVIVIFLAAAIVVWKAGTKMSGYAALVSQRSGIGGGLIGVVLLGFATSLPEVATSVTAAASGDAQLAVNNLLGGVAFQVLVLAIADAAIGRKALTSTVPSAKVMLQGVVSILLLAVALMGVTIGELPFGPVGATSIALAAVYFGGLWIMRGDDAGGWRPARGNTELEEEELRDDEPSNLKLALLTAGMAAAILAAGFILTRSAEGIAESLGVNTGLIGLTLLAAATSLPEVSTAIAAVRLRQSEMAIGDVLGGNMFDVVLILLVDIAYAGGPVLRNVEPMSATAALLGIFLTGIMLLGMIERKDRTIARMGYDSLAIIIAYLGGIALIVARS